MLLRTIGFIMLVSVLTVTMLTVTASMARIAAYERALGYIPAAYQTALAALQQSFATGAYVATAAPAPPVCVSNDDPCTFYASSSISVSTQATPQPLSACNASPNCAANLQMHPAVAEGRVSIEATLTVLNGNRQPVVTRHRYITARTFAVAPYIAVTGERDGTMANRGTASEGDNAGAPKTQIAVKYHDTTGANPDISSDRWATEGWTNGNTTPGTWSP